MSSGGIHPQNQFRVATAPVHKNYHVMPQQLPPFVADPNSSQQFMSSSSNVIEISPTIAFLVVVLIVVLLVYMIRNLNRN
jgi:hypothetical protein